MKKYSKKHNEWLEKRNKKILKNNSKRSRKKKRKNKYSYDSIEDLYGKKTKIKIIEKLLTVPKYFSIIDNTDETIAYFNKVIHYFKSKNYRTNALFFDVEEVEYITIDAIMYLLAIIYNINNSKNNILRVSGNLPKKDDIKDKFIKSGFLKILRNKDINILNDNQGILYGNNVSGDSVGKIMELSKKYLGGEKSINFLYNIIIELMENTVSHAYIKSYFVNSWYLYATCHNNIISITFIDTGLGIPETIYKKLYEKIVDIMNIKNTKYILSALQGEFRTETKQNYRGKGLPEIFEYYKKNKIKNLKIISCYEKIDTDKNDYALNLNEYLHGTVFYWEIDGND